jgi:hypothetical protein
VLRPQPRIRAGGARSSRRLHLLPNLVGVRRRRVRDRLLLPGDRRRARNTESLTHFRLAVAAVNPVEHVRRPPTALGCGALSATRRPLSARIAGWMPRASSRSSSNALIASAASSPSWACSPPASGGHCSLRRARLLVVVPQQQVDGGDVGHRAEHLATRACSRSMLVSELPGQVVRVMDPGVAAVAAVGRHRVRGVADEEHVPAPEAVRHLGGGLPAQGTAPEPR